LTGTRGRRVASAALLIPLALLASACGSADPGWSPDAVELGEHGVKVMVVNSQIGLGQNRLAFGLIADDGSLVQDAQGTLHLYRLNGDEAVDAGEHELRPVTLRESSTHLHGDGTAHLHSDPVATMYVANVDLHHTDWWGAEFAVRARGKEHKYLRTRFFVDESTSVPAVGAAAPRTTQLVARDVKDVAEIDSSTPPRPALHQLTVAEAIDSGKPSLIAFATPAFCQTRFCGPVIDSVVVPLAEQYQGRANFVHIEPYSVPDARRGRLVPAPAMEQWGLTSEPYLFVLDANGRVAARFEGITERDEVAAALDRVLAPAR
jgi:hypothetical protein